MIEMVCDAVHVLTFAHLLGTLPEDGHGCIAFDREYDFAQVVW